MQIYKSHVIAILHSFHFIHSHLEPLPYISDPDVPAEAAEHDVLHVVHVLLHLLDLGVARADRALDVLHLRLFVLHTVR